MTMRAIRWACAALVCLAGPAAAQPPDVEQEADRDDAAQEQPASDPVDPDSIADMPTGETIEIVGPAPLAPAQGSVEQLSRDEIDALPGGRGDAFETVRSLPGVAFAPVFDGAGDLAIRGTRGADSFYLVDGVPVPQTMHFGNLTAVLPVEMIDSIELLPGGFDVSYGRATGGIVEIHTRRSRADRWAGAADISFVHASAFAQGPLIRDELSIAASVRRSFIDLLLPSVVGDDGEVTFSRAPRYMDAQLRLDWAPSYRHEVSLLGLYSDDALAIQLDTENAQDPALSGRIGSSDSFWRAVATWRYDGVRIGSRAAVSYGRAVEKIGLNDTHFLESTHASCRGTWPCACRCRPARAGPTRSSPRHR
jgi:outer membrane receptor protein involved in Fe transport